MIMKTARLLISMAAIAAMTVACSDDLEQVATHQPALNTPENAVHFSTYMGRGNTTRGGAYGSIDTEKLADPNYGFGVFAYQTGTAAYSAYRTDGSVDDRYPNFMYNEHIVGDGAGGWKYADIRNTKYWPNEVGLEAVDDQNNDSGNDPAVTDYTNGGNVSFFAYAPYADFDYAADTQVNGITGQAVNNTNDGTNSGIIAFSGNLYNGETDKLFSDPYLQYRISNDSKKQVDLLWGTAGKNGENVLGNEQLGSSAEDYTEYDDEGEALENDYTETPPSIVRPTQFVNTNLTKQKTNGTVEFAFKHALAKIGGSYIGAGEGDDENGNTPTNGLMVILDIDKDGQEMGGSLQEYAEGAVDGTPYNTKVTINKIVLESEKQLTAEGLEAIRNNSTFEYTDDYVENLFNQGIFNLVTGVWHNIESSGRTGRVQTIEPTDVDLENAVNNDADNDKDAVLSNELAEPKAVNWTNDYTKDAFEALPIGVTTVAKNVYESDAQPFVFMPGSYPIITITIDYTVRTYDAKLAKKYSEVRQKVTKRLYILEEIQLNKQYNILMHLGLTSVKFTASVSDWEVVSATGSTTDPGDGSSPISTFDDEVEHVWLPINVAGITSVTIGDTEYPMPADNTITLDEITTDGDNIDLGAITFNRADGTKLVTNALNDGATITTTVANLTGVPAGDTFATVTEDDGEFTIEVPGNEGVSRSDMATIVVTGPAGVKLATLNVIIPQEGAMTTPEAAVEYEYTDREYVGLFTAVDENNIDYDIDITNVGDGGKNIMNDFARILGALYRAGGVKEITFNGSTYTWDEEGTLKGSNFKNEAGQTLVHDFVAKFSTLLGPGQFKLTLGTDRGNITFNAHIKSTAELAIEYINDSGYTKHGEYVAKVNDVTWTNTVPVDEERLNIFWDLTRFLGGIYHKGGVTAVNYKGVDYEWNDANTSKGSKWTDDNGNTLYEAITYEFRNGVPSGTSLSFTTDMGVITYTIVIE